MMIAIMAGVGALLSLLPVTAQQDDPSANRSFSPATVAPGERVTVTITVANYGQAGSVVETLAFRVHLGIQHAPQRPGRP